MTRDDPDRSAREPSADEKRLVLVVHGIGDEAPGATVGALARSIAAATGRSSVPTREVVWVPEGSNRQVEDSPCHVERLRNGGAETVLAEVFWADLSRLGHGVLDTVLGFFRLIFGLHQVAARHAANPARSDKSAPDPAAVGLQKLSLVTAHVLRGPAAAAFLMWCLGWAIGVGVLRVGGTSVNEAVWVFWIPLVVGLVSLAVGCRALRMSRGRLDRALHSWLAVLGVAVLTAVTLAHLMRLDDEVGLGELWWFTLGWSARPVNIAAYLILLAFPAWLVARLRAPLPYRPGLDLTQALNLATIGLWVLAVGLLRNVGLEILPEQAVRPETEAATDLLGAEAGLYWSMALICGGALLSTWVAHRRWSRTAEADGYDASLPAPRLAVGRGFLFCLISMPVLVFMLQAVLPAVFPDSMRELYQPLETVSKVVVLTAVLVGGAGVSVSKALRLPLDLGLDIVSHFEKQASAAEGKLAFVHRKRIQERFRIVSKTLVRLEKPTHVTVLAHSLGTIVAIEALAEDDDGPSPTPPSRWDLVTMASPVHHLLQHYLPCDYPPLSDERWDGLRQRIDRWVNIFRIDDPVGADIDPSGQWPENCPVDPGGHTGYWRDRQVLQILHDRRLV